jgi:two-component system, OmpR family, phosphate regulon sensor histidine kinase PhoR
MRGKLHRLAIITGIMAVGFLISIQIYWFTKAYRAEEIQFTEKVNLALRAVADQILKANNNHTSRIGVVARTENNRFYVPVGDNIDYPLLDSLVRREFFKHSIDEPFSLTLYHGTDSLVLGSLYGTGAASPEDPTCLKRPQAKGDMNFAVTFTDRPSHIIAAMDIWIFTAGIFAVMVLVFAFVMIDLGRQKRLAIAKNDFLSNMTHELQTPITNISMASEVLLKNPAITGEKKSRYMEIIFEENQRLKHQVERVLETTAMDMGEIRLEKQKVDMNRVIRQVVENFRLRIEQKLGQISSELRAKDPYVHGDPLHLANVLYNLLDNAEKYSPESPDIRICCENTDRSIVVSIEDKGIGISPQAQRSIFDKFYRVSKGNLHNVKGFGLGLTYVKKIVEAHSGFVTVTSQPDSGSRFVVTFPRAHEQA